MKNVLVITTSLRGNSNSDIFANKVVEGIKDAGNAVEIVSLKGKTIKFCIGCLSCQNTGECVLKDDAKEIITKIKNADSIVFVTPIYYYEMSGQLKTLLDRCNPLYGRDYNFRNIYLVMTATDTADFTPERAIHGLGGWVECFEEAKLADTIFLGGNTDPGDAKKHSEQLDQAYNFGKNIK